MSKEKQIEEMIEAIKKCSCVYTDCEQECSQCSNEELYDDTINHIARTIYDAGYRKQSEWISVDDRLPRSQQMVIGFTPCDGYMFIGFYQKVESPYYKSYWNIITSMRSTRKMTKKVTHWMPWMPLPEPPKMKGGAE